MSRRLATTVGMLAVLALGSTAEAQNPQPGLPGQTPPGTSPRGPTTTPPEQIAPREGGSSLSDTLSRNGGTMQPPAVDPGMHRTPPAASGGTMPVIPPPGTAGGNPTVVPK